MSLPISALVLTIEALFAGLVLGILGPLGFLLGVGLVGYFSKPVLPELGEFPKVSDKSLWVSLLSVVFSLIFLVGFNVLFGLSAAGTTGLTFVKFVKILYSQVQVNLAICLGLGLGLFFGLAARAVREQTKK